MTTKIIRFSALLITLMAVLIMFNTQPLSASPVMCGGDGDFCWTGGDCCSNTCIDHGCVGDGGGGGCNHCMDPGCCCDGGGDCNSGVCCNGWCSATNCDGGCAGRPCDGDGDCCSANQTCFGASPGVVGRCN